MLELASRAFACESVHINSITGVVRNTHRMQDATLTCQIAFQVFVKDTHESLSAIEDQSRNLQGSPIYVLWSSKKKITEKDKGCCNNLGHTQSCL